MELDDFYTTAEASRVLGVSRQRVAQLINEGKLDPVRPWPGTVLVPREQVDARLATAPPGWMRAADVAERHRATIEDVYRWRKQGLLNPRTIKGVLWFDPEEVRTFKPTPLPAKAPQQTIALWAVSRFIEDNEAIPATISDRRLRDLCLAFITRARPHWEAEHCTKWAIDTARRLRERNP